MAATTNNSTTAATITQSQFSPAAAGVAQAIAGVSTLVEAVEILPRRNSTTPNTGNIFIGPAGSQLRIIAPGDAAYILTAPPGKKVDISTVFVLNATAGDGIIWTAIN
jgi:hypothetical protein